MYFTHVQLPLLLQWNTWFFTSAVQCFSKDMLHFILPFGFNTGQNGLHTHDKTLFHMPFFIHIKGYLGCPAHTCTILPQTLIRDLHKWKQHHTPQSPTYLRANIARGQLTSSRKVLFPPPVHSEVQALLGVTEATVFITYSFSWGSTLGLIRFRFSSTSSFHYHPQQKWPPKATNSETFVLEPTLSSLCSLVVADVPHYMPPSNGGRGLVRQHGNTHAAHCLLCLVCDDSSS